MPSVNLQAVDKYLIESALPLHSQVRGERLQEFPLGNQSVVSHHRSNHSYIQRPLHQPFACRDQNPHLQYARSAHHLINFQRHEFQDL